MEDDELGHAFDEWRGVIDGELMRWIMMGMLLLRDIAVVNVVVVDWGGGGGWRHDALFLGLPSSGSAKK